MEIVFAITEILFGGPLSNMYICGAKLRYLSCFWHSDKSNYVFAQNHLPYSSRSPSCQVIFKQNILSDFSFTNF